MRGPAAAATASSPSTTGSRGPARVTAPNVGANRSSVERVARGNLPAYAGAAILYGDAVTQRRLLAAAATGVLLLAIAPDLPPERATASAAPISERKTIRVRATEYYSPPERAFRGRRVSAPGLRGRYRVDFLYSAQGVAMEGDGVAFGRRHVHICGGFELDFITVSGRRAFVHGPPAWLAASYWKNRRNRLTFPLEAGGWSNGRGVRFRGVRSARFCRGTSRDIRPYQTIAVDPRLIPLGSRVYIGFYRRMGLSKTGWFTATDTGGAIKGRHIDVYRPYPDAADPDARNLRSVHITVVPPEG